jgi:NAD(P)-dependent dehydrogenase (short-subunit alcohol dehydrogenase family)
MKNKIAIITGSAGLIGSQACDFFSERGYKIIGIAIAINVERNKNNLKNLI